MRRWSLVLLLSTASPVLAQEAQENPVPAEQPAPQVEPAEAPVQAAPVPAAQQPVRRRRVRQEAAAEVPAPSVEARAPTAPAPAPAAPAPVAEAPESAPQPGSPQEEVRDEARYLLSYLLTGDVRGTLPMLAFPFQLEERRFDTAESLVVTWAKQLRQKRTDLITLYDVEVLPYAEMEKKYGKPPARLGPIVPRGAVYAAVANLSGRAAVILYQHTGEGWRAVAYTD